jgi:hypothetical protein
MTDTIKKITDLLFIPQNIKKSDITIILGNDFIDTINVIEPFYRQNILGKIIITGHSPNADKEPEAERFFKRAVALGFSIDDITLETRSTNTKENFEFTKEIIDKNFKVNDIKTITIVCLAFHTRRALMTARNIFEKDIEFNFIPIVDGRKISAEDWPNSKESTDRVLEEVRRIAIYSAKGDLSLD